MDDGLLDSQEVESQIGDTATKQTQHTFDAESGVDFKLFGKGLEGKINYIIEKMKSNEQSEIYREVRTKKLHDNAFDRFMNYLDSSNQLSNSARSIGSFIKFSGELQFIDLRYLSAQFKQNGLIEFIKSTQAVEIENSLKKEHEDRPREERRASKDADIKNALKK